MGEIDNSNRDIFIDDLTWREQEVLSLLTERLTNREIAVRLHLAESTVKDYVARILSKLYVKNRRQAVERAEALGLLEGERKARIRAAIILPAEPTPFVGRKGELAEINRRLAETRLLTLIGPGGIGKTRLALKAAEGVAGDFVDGCYFVSLVPIHSVDLIIQTIAEGVRFPLATHEDPQHQLIRYLRGKQILLVIDSFEHLLDGAGFISEIVKAAPGVKVMATSRERLNLQSETMLVVGGMDLPEQTDEYDPRNFDAIRLFVQSANKVRPGYDPSPAELARIAGICRIVQGMPLAIELAAAWLHILSVEEIHQELEKGIEILSTDTRDAPERHRSIHSVFDHSWMMLDESEQDIFMHLSVFQGGFTRHAAQNVTGASLQNLTGFVNKSFFSLNPDSGRLEIHEMLRQYTQEKLEKDPDGNISAQENHAAYYAEFMEQKWAEIKDERQIQAIAEIEAEIKNVRLACRYYLNQKKAFQLRKFIQSFREFCWIRGWNQSGMELFAEVVAGLDGLDDEESVVTHALAMAYQGYFMSWLGLSDEGFELAKGSVRILNQLDRPEALVFAYESLALNAYYLNLFPEEMAGKNKLLTLAKYLDDKWLMALAFFELSMVAIRNDNYLDADRLAKSSLDFFQEIGNSIRSTLSLLPIGHAAMARGEYEVADDCYRRILQISRDTGFLWGIGKASKYLGNLALSIGKTRQAEEYLLESLKITNEIGLVTDKLNLLIEYACLLSALGDTGQAAGLLRLIIQHPASHQFRLGEGRIIDSAERMLAEIEQRFPAGDHTADLERSHELEIDEVILELVRQNR
jgi:predicted ATPase/DNA-binding CsgD family transcriptional regulator